MRYIKITVFIRDIKSDQIQLNDGIAKLAGFGFTVELEGGQRSSLVSREGGEIGLFIILVPKVSYLLANNFGDILNFDWFVYGVVFKRFNQ